MPHSPSIIVLAGVEPCRKRLWAHSYRMTATALPPKGGGQ
jgi:hypothetical protein